MNANGFTAIWFILLKLSKQNGEVLNMVSWNIITIYIQMVIIHSDYILCARSVLLVTPDSFSSLPGCSMRVLPPPMLLNNCLSCSPLGGPGPPLFPPPGLTPFPSGTSTLLLRWLQLELYSVKSREGSWRSAWKVGKTFHCYCTCNGEFKLSDVTCCEIFDETPWQIWNNISTVF
jgi:hypothetical protein